MIKNTFELTPTSRKFLEELIANPSISDEKFEELLISRILVAIDKENHSYITSLLKNVNLSKAAFDAIFYNVKKVNTFTRLFSSITYTPLEHLIKVAEVTLEHNSYICLNDKKVGSNPSLPQEYIHRFVESPFDELREIGATNPSISTEDLEVLLKDENSSVVDAALSNPKTTLEMGLKAKIYNLYHFLETLASHQKEFQYIKLLFYLSLEEKDWEFIHWEIAEWYNPYTSSDRLEKLEDQYHFNSSDILEHPNCSEKFFKKFRNINRIFSATSAPHELLLERFSEILKEKSVAGIDPVSSVVEYMRKNNNLPTTLKRISLIYGGI